MNLTTTEIVIDLLANDLLIALRFKTMEEAKQAFDQIKSELDDKGTTLSLVRRSDCEMAT